MRSLTRRLGSRVYNGLLLDSGIHDYNNRYRFYNREEAELLLRFPARYKSPVYLVEMMAVWLANGLRVVEMPTVYGARRGGSSKVVPGDFVRGLAGALRVGFACRAGRYRLPDSREGKHCPASTAAAPFRAGGHRRANTGMDAVVSPRRAPGSRRIFIPLQRPEDRLKRPSLSASWPCASDFFLSGALFQGAQGRSPAILISWESVRAMMP